VKKQTIKFVSAKYRRYVTRPFSTVSFSVSYRRVCLETCTVIYVIYCEGIGTSAATAALSVAWFVSTFIGPPLLGIVRSTAVFVLARYSWRTISTFHVGSTAMPFSLRSLTYLSLVQCLRSLESLTLVLRLRNS
jgi:hypothetical protein